MATDDPAATLEEWRETERAAPSGPWKPGYRTWTEISDERCAEARINGSDGAQLAITFLSGLLEPGCAGEVEAFIVTARTAMPLLLAAVEAALRNHEPMPTYAPAEHADGSSACGHDPDRPSHFEADTGEMLCGESPGPPVCSWCEDNLLDPGEAEWPCPVYADITAALAGEAGDGR